MSGGILFTLYLQTQVATGVYFSGDGGLKALLAQQLGSGLLQFNLSIPEADWVQQLWNDGLYPYDEPYVYQVAEKYFITFPYTFPLVTAPFYSLLGDRGLYIIPLVSCWFTWLVFYWDCLRLKLASWITALGLFALIFASYLTIYSAMYWEHTLAVALSFSGISYWFLAHRRSSFQGIISGIAVGLAVWFRPEFICTVAIFMGLGILNITYSWWQKLKLAKEFKPLVFPIKEQIIYLSAMLLTVGGFFLNNKLIYGYVVGIHGIQVVESVQLSDRFLGAWRNFTDMTTALFYFFPLLFVPIAYGLICFYRSWLNKKLSFNWLWLIVCLAIFSYIIGVSLLVPVGTAGLISGGKQWGIRFLLLVVPVVVLLICSQLQAIEKDKAAKYMLLSLFSMAIAFGIAKNTFEATKALQKNTIVAVPAIQYLATDSNSVIATSHQFVGQALEAATTDKYWFTVDTPGKLIQLAQTLTTQSINSFTYICYPHRACNVPEFSATEMQFIKSDRIYQIELQSKGKFGKYPIYSGEIK